MMISLTREQINALRNWFQPERPGPLIGPHVIHTGHGACLVDRWPAPQVVLVETAANYALLGNAQVITAADFPSHLQGFVAAGADFIPLLRAAFPDLETWPRIIFSQREAPSTMPAAGSVVRRLAPSDVPLLQAMTPESAWIYKTWGSAAGLAGSGYGWGAFVNGELASVACTFFLGETYEEIGVATEPQHRGQGLSTACAGALCTDIHARGHRPSWTTSPDNVASIRVAQKLGFTFQRHDHLYVVGISIPRPATD